VREETLRAGVHRTIPVSVMMETPGAVHDAWAIAALPGVASLDFGTLDFVSAHHGAIPATAMQSPGQFDHPLVRRAKCEVAAAALAHAVVPAHGVTLALDDPDVVYADARRAREEFGFLRMWSIHPAQIRPIVRAFRPDAVEVRTSAAVLAAARAAVGRRSRHDGKLYDRASYRYCWDVLRQAHAAGAAIPAAASAFLRQPCRRVEPGREDDYALVRRQSSVPRSRERHALQVIGAINAYTRAQAERTGFRALYLSGGVSPRIRSACDLGISTLEDARRRAPHHRGHGAALACRHRHRLGQRFQYRAHDSLDDQEAAAPAPCTWRIRSAPSAAGTGPARKWSAGTRWSIASRLRSTRAPIPDS
jgi:hypothetical protein